LSVLLRLQLVGPKLPLQGVHVACGVVLDVGLRRGILGFVRSRWSLLPGADDGCQEQEDNSPEIEKHLEVLLQHALRLRSAVGKLWVCNGGDGIGHFVNPFS
jgi:hypothetical protein